jgi:hypothetical protein
MPGTADFGAISDHLHHIMGSHANGLINHQNARNRVSYIKLVIVHHFIP